jgi:polyisoprenyl-teichoic acid--peptidoglycan teichoic acid transferase
MAKARYYTVKTKRRKIKKGRLLFLLALFGFLLSLFFSIRFLGALSATQDQSAWASALPTVKRGEPENILLYSVSDTNGGTVTCLALATHHAAEGTFNIMAVPVETLTDVPEFGFMRLAHVYGAGGRELLAESVSTLLDMPIHTYLEINETFLPRTLDYIESSSLRASLGIDNGGDILAKIHANGLTAEQHLEQRRLILAALSTEVMSRGMLGKLRTFLELSPLVKTNLSWRTFLSRLDSYKTIQYKEAATVALLPGRTDVQADGSYWLPDMEELTYLMVWMKNPQAKIPKSQIQVQVLNGSGTSGVAGALAKKLESQGYTIIHVGNAERQNYEVSQVISHIEDMDAAKDIAILVPNAQLLKDEASGNAHVTVIVGKDYQRE